MMTTETRLPDWDARSVLKEKIALVCFSGGLDTTLIVIRYLNSGYKVIPFWVDYNQWEVREQSERMEKLLRWIHSGCLYPLVKVKAELPGGPVGHASGRVLMSLGLAVMYADRSNLPISIIATGYRGISHYPESHEGMQELLIQAIERLGYLYQVPLLGMSKSQIGRELALHGVPWELMNSCYWSPPCSSKSENDSYLCGGCRNKVEAMRAAGVTDPSLLRRPNVNS